MYWVLYKFIDEQMPRVDNHRYKERENAEFMLLLFTEGRSKEKIEWARLVKEVE